MKTYVALIESNLRLALRERIAIFFNYVFPLIFFFAFGQMVQNGRVAAITQVVGVVLITGILGNGLFGGGIRAVQDREQNILRRFKVAPISPAPLLVASMVTGWVLYLPAAIIIVLLAHFTYGMPIPERWAALLVLVSVAVVAFRALGLIIASVANSSQESQILVQLVYLPMLFTAVTISMNIRPRWLEIAGRFLPASYLMTGLQGILLRREGLMANGVALAAMLATTAIATLVSVQLFRWEKEERIRTSAKLWLLAVILPFVILGFFSEFVQNG